jgi:hypothetical protein
MVVFCATQSLVAQQANPFELLWRKDSSGGTAYVPPVAAPDAETGSITPGNTTITPVLPEPTSQVPVEVDTTSIPIDTAKTDSTLISSDTISTSDTIASIASNLGESNVIDTSSKAPDLPESPSKSVQPKAQTPLTLVLLFGAIFAILAWALSLNRELLRKIYRAALNENLSSLLYREQRFATTQYLYYTIYIIFLVAGGMFLYFVGRYFDWDAWALRTVWSCIALVTTIYLLRHLTLSILGNAYPVTKETTHFSFNIVLHNILLGIALIPVNLLLAFGPDGLYGPAAITGIVLCAGIYLLRQFRGLLIAGGLISANFFHFFIYLCAVEILPLFTLVKFFHN